VALVLGAAFILMQGPAGGHASASGGNVVAVDAYMSGFSTYRIEATVDQPITISLRSMDSSAHGDGGGKHQLAIDEFGVNIIAPPKGVTELTFTPDKPGTFLFYCDICCGGKVNPTMRGEFVVSA
jgi:heme/copper-type cytochrome/quinol oxidase subunit 2